MKVRSVSFDTSFLLRDHNRIDKVLKALQRDSVPCFVTSTVVSELEQLKVWGRIDERTYKRATGRWKRVGARVIDFKNRVLSSEFHKECTLSMGEHHGVEPGDIANDCRILVSVLKNDIDVFLSEDFHFTSRISREVVGDITSQACTEYHQMCGEELYSIDSRTFLEAYGRGALDLSVVEASLVDIAKPGKRI